MHFDLAVDPQRQDAYYFIRIAVMAYDVVQPEVQDWDRLLSFARN